MRLPSPGPCSGRGSATASDTAVAMLPRVVIGLTPVIAACVNRVTNGTINAIR